MGFPRQEYWSGLPFPFPGDLSDPGIEPGYPWLQADSLLRHQGNEDYAINIQYQDLIVVYVILTKVKTYLYVLNKIQ